MNTKKTNYFKYALGEIFLVVIGILIAVSINNWNEKRKQKNELSNLLEIVKEDIAGDIEEIDRILNGYEELKVVYQRVLNGEMTAADYIGQPKNTYMIVGYPEMSFNQRGVNLLREFKSDKGLLKQKIVDDIIEFYNERMLEIKVDDELRADDFKANFKYWKNNADWWADYIQRKDISRFIDYALNSADYKNRVATSHFLTYTVYLPELKKFKKRGQALIQSIEES